ncbi:7TM diverse intracellular signaling domain-containing protein [Mucilaginibacter sp.]|uniref:sensor histidine kinase n=1 Tax=Mucilaginibacter sp. TaxID=1882438 RepID=UPI003B007130
MNFSINYFYNLLLIFIVSINNSSAENIIVINKNISTDFIGKQVSIFQDTSKKLTFSDIQKSKNLFQKCNSNVINLGLNNYYNWLNFKIYNNAKERNVLLKVEYPIIDEVILYIVHQDNSIDSIKLYESFKKSKRLFNNQFYIFPLRLKQNEQVTCYMRLFSYKPILVPITIDSIESTVQKIITIDLISGIYIGIMCAMLLYNLFISFTTKDNDYFFYVIYIAGVTITQLTILGYSNKFIWPNIIWLTTNAVTLVGGISGIVTCLFTVKFLNTKKNLPKFHTALYILIIIDIIALFILVLGYKILSYHIIDLNAGIGAIIILLTGLLLVLKGNKQAKFFLVGWTIFIIAIFLYVMKDYGILPYNNLTIHSLQFGSAMEALLLSFALADKINIYKQEKEISQATELFVLQENKRIISEQNVTLERNVKERTSELVATNKNLNKTLTDLKEAQTQLVEAEKMASLGQLTAGIAHEINNPINFVTSNVAPLRRDVDILVDAIFNIESLGLSDAADAEKQQQIEDYKEEIDLDYVKIEINHLLNGIHEGATRTADIVKGLKIFSRLDEDDLKKADINEGIISTLTIANNLIGNKIQVIRDLGNIPVIECYPGKLNQVFLNIISNAVFAIQEKFDNQPGGILKITTTYDETYLFIKIEDNGTGMSEATKNKIFEPFFTTKNVGVGTGLGMSIVYNTIKKHNAEIYLNSTEGVGTEFIMQLNLVFTAPIEDHQSGQ